MAGEFAMFGKVVGCVAAIIMALYIMGSISTPPNHTLSELQVPRPVQIATAQQQRDPTIIDVLNAPRNSSMPALPPPSNYEALCTEKWTKRGVTDWNMERYCVSEERRGYAELGDAISRYKGLFWLDRVVQVAEEKWTKRGIRQDSMVSYELKQQIEAFLNLQYSLHQPGFDEAAGTACLIKWTRNAAPDWNMIEYCYKQQTGRG